MIEFQGVSISYKDCITISEFTESFKIGEHIALTGESGSGKTTLLKSIIGLILPFKGTITVNKKEITHPNIGKIRAQIAFVPQDVNLPYDTVREVVQSFFNFKANQHLSWTEDEITSIFNMLGLPKNSIERRMTELSGGERQRVLLSIALASKKPILLMDEPTSSLDRVSVRKLIDYIKTMNNQTIVSVTHDAEFAESFDRIINFKKLNS